MEMGRLAGGLSVPASSWKECLECWNLVAVRANGIGVNIQVESQ